MTKEEKAAYDKIYRVENKERIKEYNKEYRENHKEEWAIYSKKWKEDNKDKVREGAKKYYNAHKEELIKYQTEYYHSNRQVWKKHQSSSVYKEYQRVYQSQRRKDLKDRGSYSPKDIKDLYATQGGNCYYCRIDIEAGYHIEHMTPLSRDGRNDISNICLACVPCNLQKHTKTAKEFMIV